MHRYSRFIYKTHARSLRVPIVLCTLTHTHLTGQFSAWLSGEFVSSRWLHLYVNDSIAWPWCGYAVWIRFCRWEPAWGASCVADRAGRSLQEKKRVSAASMCHSLIWFTALNQARQCKSLAWWLLLTLGTESPQAPIYDQSGLHSARLLESSWRAITKCRCTQKGRKTAFMFTN